MTAESVESGEGIERRGKAEGALRRRKVLWNPVKELKVTAVTPERADVDWGVESGEGIESIGELVVLLHEVGVESGEGIERSST